MVFSASSEARDRNAPTNANQIRLQTSPIRQEHRPIRYQLPARLSFRQGQPEAREGQAGRLGVAERFVVPLKPGNSGGGKGPQFKTGAIRREGPWRLGNLSTPINGQKLQKALHAKA